jgi:hypothetical protein
MNSAVELGRRRQRTRPHEMIGIPRRTFYRRLKEYGSADLLL